MVCQSTEGNSYFHHPHCSPSLLLPLPPPPILPPPPPPDVMEPSETSVFLPVVVVINSEESDGDNYNFNRGNNQNDPDFESGSNSNLGLLVISEGTPLESPEKLSISDPDPEDISSNNNNNIDKHESDGAVYRSCTYDSDNDERGSVNFKEKQCSGSGRKKSCCRNYMGILLTLVSGLVFTIGGVIVKYLGDYHPFTLAIFRFQGILLPSLAMVLYAYYVKKIPVFEPIWPLGEKEKQKRVFGMLMRSVFGTTALLLHFYALRRLDVADALVIGACQPVFVTIAAYFFLGEACGVFPVFTALFTILGVGIISRPPILTGEETFDENALLGAGFSMASMLSATMVFVILRYLKDVHVSVLTLFLGCWGTIQSVTCSIVIGEFKLPQSPEHWALAVALALVTLIGQMAMTLALQCEQAGPVALIRTCDCLFAFILQFILLNTLPDLFSLSGASIIIFCVILTATRKWLTVLPQGHPAKKRFWFLLV